MPQTRLQLVQRVLTVPSTPDATNTTPASAASTDHLVEYILEFVLLWVFAALPQQQITVSGERNGTQCFVTADSHSKMPSITYSDVRAGLLRN